MELLNHQRCARKGSALWFTLRLRRTAPRTVWHSLIYRGINFPATFGSGEKLRPPKLTPAANGSASGSSDYTRPSEKSSKGSPQRSSPSRERMLLLNAGQELYCSLRMTPLWFAIVIRVEYICAAAVAVVAAAAMVIIMARSNQLQLSRGQYGEWPLYGLYAFIRTCCLRECNPPLAALRERGCILFHA